MCEQHNCIYKSKSYVVNYNCPEQYGLNLSFYFVGFLHLESLISSQNSIGRRIAYVVVRSSHA